MVGFKYKWKEMSKVSADPTINKGWFPVKIADAAPCVIKTEEGYERLGMINLQEEKAEVGWNDQIQVYDGPQVKKFMVLCRKPGLN